MQDRREHTGKFSARLPRWKKTSAGNIARWRAAQAAQKHQAAQKARVDAERAKLQVAAALVAQAEPLPHPVVTPIRANKRSALRSEPTPEGAPAGAAAEEAASGAGRPAWVSDGFLKFMLQAVRAR